jgi:hypothetical protein
MRTKLLPLSALASVLLLADAAGGVKWTMPAGWKSQGARPMRAATYEIPAAPGDKEAGECGVFYFGPGQGGTVEDNVNRWVDQFEQPGGKPSRQSAQIHTQTINGLRVTTVDASGTYTGAGGPMAQQVIRKPGYRLLGAIVEAPQGPVFFKFTGPAKTVAANQGAFQAMLKSLSRS